MRLFGYLRCGFGGFFADNAFHVLVHPFLDHAAGYLFDNGIEAAVRHRRRRGCSSFHAVIEAGGCLTGEHGVGIEKRDLMGVQFAPEDMEAQMRVKDVFDPAWLLNPAKVFPLEVSASRRQTIDTAA